MKQACGILSACVMVLLLLLQCGGTSDEVLTGSRATARIFMPDGKTPAAGAIVKVFGAGSTDGRCESRQTTGADGRFSLEDLPVGIYNIWAEKDSLVVFQDSAIIQSDDTILRDDTLGCPSIVTGIIAIEPQDDPRSVTVGIVGLDKFLKNIGSDGRFTIHHMAEGTYTLILESTLPNYTPTAFDVFVKGCSNDTIRDTLRLTFTGIPIVTGLSATCDTAAGSVHLVWNPTDDENLQNYVIYKDYFSAAVLSTEPFAAVEDTFYTDRIFDSGCSDTGSVHLRYRVAIRTDVNVIGPTFRSADIVAVPPFRIKPRCMFSSRQTAKNIISGTVPEKTDHGIVAVAGTASVNDTMVVSVRAVSETRWLAGITWTDSAGNVLRIADCPETDTVASDSIICIYASTGVYRLVCSVTDEADDVWADTARVRVVDDAPQIRLSITDPVGGQTDTTRHSAACAFGDTVGFHLEASDRFGSIVNTTWRLGDTTVSSMTLDTFIIVPDSASAGCTVSATVSDDDGNSVTDSLTVLPALFAPSTLKAPFQARRDQAGMVFRDQCWIFGGMGIAEVKPRTTAVPLSDVWTTVDGKAWRQVQTNAPGRSGHAMLNFNGALWLIGGFANSWGGYRNDVWRSTDGISWTCVVDSTPFSPRGYFGAAVFNERLWISGGLAERAAAGDVWSSADGLTWDKAGDAAFGQRCYHTCAVFNDKLWVIGGRDTSFNPLNDVWSTTDGSEWSRVSADAGFSPRQGHACISFDNKLWVTGGYGFSASDMADDCWSSSDGATWNRMAESDSIFSRAFHTGIVFRDRMFVIAGMTGYTVLANDVWRSGIAKVNN